MFNDKISQRNYPARTGYCASYYLSENSHWHPVQSPAAPKPSSDKDIPWLVSFLHSHSGFVWSSAQNNGEKSWRCGLGPSPCAVSILLHLGLFFLLDFFCSCSLKLEALPAKSFLSLCACHAHITGTWNQRVIKLVTDQQWLTGTWTLSFISQTSLLSPAPFPQSNIKTDICNSVFLVVTHINKHLSLLSREGTRVPYPRFLSGDVKAETDRVRLFS